MIQQQIQQATSMTTDNHISRKHPTIHVGILSLGNKEDKHAKNIAESIRQLAPDRFDVTIVGEEDSKVDVLIVPNSSKAEHYIQKNGRASIVLSELSLDNITSDRRIFYDLLQAHRQESILKKLPVRAYANRDGSATCNVVVRREHIEIDGKMILKPCMERPASAQNADFRIYYPKSSGGGCKHLQTGRFHADLDDVRPDGSYIYEELMDYVDAPEKIDQRRYRKRDRMRDAAYSAIPSLDMKGEIPHYDDDDDITYESDLLSRTDRKFYIVTTASLPWMTGTAVNPLLRAAYLARGRPKGSVTLVIPWLSNEEDRKQLYGKYDFKTPDDQEAHVRQWLREKAHMPEEADPQTGLQILWYDSRYHTIFKSIFSVEDICKLIPDESADVCVLEEPEHLNWFRAEGDSWTKKFNFTVGIVHTNYKAYAGAQIGGTIAAPVISGMSTLVVRAYCNKIIKLSPVLQTFSPEKEIVCNVHGVRGDFVSEGERRAKDAKQNGTDHPIEGARAYFVGKILWAKGLDKLMNLQHFYRKTTGSYFPIDIIGDGPELEEIRRAYLGRSTANKSMISNEGGGNLSSFDFDMPKTIREFRRTPIPANFLGRHEHFEKGHGDKYKIFINPSVTEVLCTTTAEALAMGKFAIIPAHPSNVFFLQFPNCLSYQNKLEFAANLRWALEHEPEPLTAELTHQFTWEAATDRFIAASAITMREERIRSKAQKSKIDDRIAAFHIAISKGKRGDVARILAGAGPVARQSGKWQPYFDNFRHRAYGAIETTVFFAQDYFVWFLLSIVLIIIPIRNLISVAAVGYTEL
uniref:Digalactosyldiacylglycerol synthase n=2 Tax=Ditylum brightwellii TaxID=49249 RepID=A0A7S4V6D4_9STRA